ncbi:hypothetical protein D6D06_07785, partial [Aureobasidium pullulans]
RVIDPFSGVIDPRRVSGGSSRHEACHRKDIAIHMLLIFNKSTRKETALYYHPTIFTRGKMCVVSRDVRREKDMKVLFS